MELRNAAEAPLDGRHMAMVSFSPYPADPRPRRAAETLRGQGMTIDAICLQDGTGPARQNLDGLDIVRVPIRQRRGGKFAYAYQYSAFILIATWILALRVLRRRYDLVYVNNMPDVLVVCALVPKWLGAKVILDLHDPMPELMRTIFGFSEESWAVRIIRYFEKWSMARADLVLTVNEACKRIFGNRSCDPGKIGVVMNSPDELIFPFREARSYARRSPGRPFVMMYHGLLAQRNGLDLAIEALGIVRAAVPHIEFRIYGKKNDYLDQVMEQVRSHGLDGCVRYMGFRRLEDLARDIEACDVGIIPNHRNAFTEINTPTRIFEYLALGKAVIAPRTPGIEDYFGSEGLFFFEPGNAAELARTMEHVAANEDEATATAEDGQRIYRDHSWSQERLELIGLVRDLLRPART
ncbi:MAG: glycosyltransferase family 4 protein [Bryobacterales bacterium]|nr:glycosyltransferase family 4 protein [Bryobacterales bacterium]